LGWNKAVRSPEFEPPDDGGRSLNVVLERQLATLTDAVLRLFSLLPTL